MENENDGSLFKIHQCNKGVYSQCIGRECQDKCKVIEGKNRIAIVLCDGAGSTQYGGLAAELVSEILAEHLHKHFYYYMSERKINCLLSISQVLERELLKYAQRNKIDPKELATTIIAAVVTTNGEFICVHMGDGIILWKQNGDEEFQLLSSPKNGKTLSETHLTMNSKISEHMRFYRWREKKNTLSILMMTDGMQTLLGSNPQESMLYGTEQLVCMDDFSFAYVKISKNKTLV